MTETANSSRFEPLARGALATLLFFGVLTEWYTGFAATHTLQAGMLALFAGWAGWRAVRGGRFKAGVPAWLLIAAAAWGVAQVAAGSTVYAFATWRAVLHWGACGAAFLLAADLFRRPDIRSRGRAVAAWAGFVLSAVATVQQFTSRGKVLWLFPTNYREFVMGPFINRDHYASFIELLLPVVLYQASIHHKSRVAYTVMAGAMYASVVSAASRAGAILATAEVALMVSLVILRRVRAGLPWRLPLGVAAAAAVFTAVVGWQVLWARFQEPDPWKFRREVDISCVRMIQERPAVGYGLGTFEYAYPAFAILDLGLRVNHAHNDWAEWAAEGGLPFAAIMLALALWSVRTAVHAPWAAGVVAMFLHCAVDYPLQSTAMFCWTMAVLGAAVVATSGSCSGGASTPEVSGGRRSGA